MGGGSKGNDESDAVAEMVWREEKGVSRKVKAFFAPKKKRSVETKRITMAELAKHNKRDDLWICVEGHAYDVTKYVKSHPGGWLPLVNLAGKDVTDAFANYHPSSVYKYLLPSYYVGKIEDYKVSQYVKDHREIRQKLLERGLFETSTSYYVKYITWYAVLFLSAVYCTLAFESTSMHMLGASLMALFWQQFAFFGHDIGHNAISHDRKKDLWWGILFGNTLGGISLGWWKRSHNVHHIVCNSIENDPDIQHMPIFAVTDSIFGKFFSSYHQKWVTTDAAAKFLVSWQHLLFYPVMFFARFNLYAQSYLLLLSKEYVQFKNMELATLVTFAAWFSAMIATLPSWEERIAYAVLSHGLAGVLHVQICLSHFSMHNYHGQAYNSDDDEWFRMQVMTTMNINCSEWMDWFHGGLQFQIEHHLWPRLPRHNLREARKYTKALCKKYKIHYHEPGWFEAQKEMVSAMRDVALKARKLEKGDGGFYQCRLYDGLNARG